MGISRAMLLSMLELKVKKKKKVDCELMNGIDFGCNIVGEIIFAKNQGK
jgi:hypothetical protein